MKRLGYMYLFFLMITSLTIPLNFENILSPQNSLQKRNYAHKNYAITYKLENWRRLGDHITTYCKAKYFSYIYRIPLFYRPFPYSDQFEVHQKEQMLTPEIEKKFSKVIPINTIKEFEGHYKNSNEPILFECHFLTETPWLYTFSRQHLPFEQEIKKLFTPLTPIEPLPKPPSVITVALHVRKGGGFDRPLASQQEYTLDKEHTKGFYLLKNNIPGSCTDIWPINWPASIKFVEEIKKLVMKKNNFSDYIWPVKFPPDQYYIEQLKQLAKMLPNKNLLVYLFTDDPNPESIMQRYSKALSDYPRIIFSYRQADNRHNKNVIEDLFAIAQCDCLISASSSFSFVAQLLGNHSIIIFPVHAITLPDKIFINKVGVISLDNIDDLKNRRMSYNEIVHKIK